MERSVRVFLAIILVLASTLPALAVGDPNDAEGSQDPPLLTRMPGFHIYNATVTEFDRHEYPISSGEAQAVEGRTQAVVYYANDGITLPSGLQVVRNYANAIKSIGGKEIYEFEDGGTWYATMKATGAGVETWVQVEAASNGMYTVHVTEQQLMSQGVTADAASLAGAIRSTGKAAVYGIYFDTDKAEIKAASDAALAEIGKLLASNPKLKLYVVGHTDNTGAFDHNVELSNARAKSVTQALTTRFGVDAARLKPFGAGPTCPAASNDTDEGRAKNRRVELVAQ